MQLLLRAAAAAPGLQTQFLAGRQLLIQGGHQPLLQGRLLLPPLVWCRCTKS